MPIVRSLMMCLLLGVGSLTAQPKETGTLKAPEPGYIFPAGGKAGTTIEVDLGGFDWTPDVQFFSLDPRMKIVPHGELGPVLVPPPPFWFGAKSTIPALPLPREHPAKITLSAGLPSGPVRWTVAGASGVGAATGIFWVGTEPEVVEDSSSKLGQTLPTLPVTVNGRLSRLEEVDRYIVSVPKNGPITCELFGRRLGADMNLAISVLDDNGVSLVDQVDTEGNDPAVTFHAEANKRYTLLVRDLDFRGDRSFVYRMVVSKAPRVVATIPAMGMRGKTMNVEFLGYGIVSGMAKLESVTRSITFPADPKLTEWNDRLDTAWGKTPAFSIPMSDNPVSLAVPGSALTLPASITGIITKPLSENRFSFTGKKGDVFDIHADARRFGSPLDLSLSILNAEGKALLQNDDLPDTTDAGLVFTVPADAVYTVVVEDLSGRNDTRTAIYHLTIEKPQPDFALTTSARINGMVGSTVDLAVKAVRRGGFKDAITVAVSGLPKGVSVPANLVIPEGKADLKITFTVANTAPASASIVTITGTGGAKTRLAEAPIPGNRASRNSDEERTDSLVMATTLLPRLTLVAVEADGGRKVHRGSTHLAEVILERLNGFQGEVSLQMSSKQGYQRQGITGPELLVPTKESRAFYPCFMPEWLETTRTSRMQLVGVVQVPDPGAAGKLRYLVTAMKGRITMSIEGSILTVETPVSFLALKPGDAVEVPVSVLRAAKLAETVTLTLQVPDELRDVLKADPVTVPVGQTAANMRLICVKPLPPGVEASVTIRGTAMQEKKYAVVSEVTIELEPKTK